MSASSVKPVALLGAVLGVGALAAIFYQTRRSEPKKTRPRSGITLSDLRDPDIRAEHLEFNTRLLREFPTDDAIEVDDDLEGSPVFLVHKHERVMEVIGDHKTFTSNPWPYTRSLVTLNTMDKADHDRVYRHIKRFYAPAGIEHLRDRLETMIAEHGDRFIQDGDGFRFCKRLHMHLSLIATGMFDSMECEDPVIDQFIEWNDAAVRLAAPLGGVGRKPTITWGSISKLITEGGRSLNALCGLIRRIGLVQTYRLIEPIESLWPSAPFTHCWDYPEELSKIPAYFNRLYDLMSVSRSDSPAGALFAGIGSDLSAAEALATAVQLMVNMTTANALMSLIYRRCFDPSVDIQTALHEDAPLQRNPRRAKQDGRIGDIQIPKGSIVLLMMGAANQSCPIGGVSMTFGFGLHHCLGRHLVTLEMQLVDKWLRGNGRINGMKLVRAKRLTDVDVGNWGFRELRVAF